MKNLLRLLLFTLGLPVLAAAMSWACISKLDDSLREQVHRQYPKVTAEELGQITVSSLAAQGGFDAAAELPVIYRYLVYARTTAIAAGVIGLVLIGAIAYAGRVTLKRRDLLLRIFRPGVFVTLSVVGVLTAAQALSVAYAAYYFESLYIERVHMILIIGISIGGVLAFVAVVRALFSLKASSGFDALAQSVTPAEQPALWETVRQVCAELNATPPDNIVLGIEPSFYVTESVVTTSSGEQKGRTLFLSLSLSRLLNPSELRAIIGHEMAHFIGEDTVFSQRFFPVYRATLAALNHLSGNAVHSSIAIAQIPAVSFLGFFFESFVASEKNLSRMRETEADAVGAKVGGAANLATALVKVHAYADGWQKIVEDVRFNAESLRAETNLSQPFRARAAALDATALAKTGETHVFHPTDSHPPLAERLRSLNTDLASTLPLTVVPAFEHSSAALIDKIEAMEAAQSAELKKLVRPD